MNFIKTALLTLAGLAASSAYAQGESPAEAAFTPSFVRSYNQDNPGSVQEYDGRRYQAFEGALDLSAEGQMGPMAPYGYLDLGVSGVYSTEESAYFALGLGRAFSLKGDLDTLTHRQPFTRSLIVYRGDYRYNPEATNKGALTSDEWFKRQTGEVKASIDLPEKYRTSLFAEFWREIEWGSMIARWPNVNLGKANVGRQTQEYSAGAAVEAGEDSGVVVEHLYRTFDDYAQPVHIGNPATLGNLSRPRASGFHSNSNELKFRCSPSETWAFTGFLANDQRNNSFNGYVFRSYTGTLSSAYSPGKDFALTARLYSRGTVIRENWNFKSLASPTVRAPQQVDKNTVRGELSARYRLGHAHLKGGYKVEANQRRDAPAEVFGEATYDTGLYVSSNSQSNAMASQDTRHIVTLAAGVELPLDIEVEGGVKVLRANRPVFENAPDRQETANLGVSVPLPLSMSLYASADYLQEKNTKSTLARGKRFEDLYLVGLNWAGKALSLGADLGHENTRTYSDGYFGTGMWTYAGMVNTLYIPGMPYLARNDSVSGHFRARLPKDFTLTGRGSFGRMYGSVPVWMTTFRSVAGKDPAAPVTDLAPMNTHITRSSLGLEYSPGEGSLSARLSHRIDQWVDKLDPLNSGRVDVTEAGVSLKF